MIMGVCKTSLKEVGGIAPPPDGDFLLFFYRAHMVTLKTGFLPLLRGKEYPHLMY
jgi:hypothetical protein